MTYVNSGDWRVAMSTPPHIVAIVPCHNEELTIGKVVTDLKAAVPGMTVYVYDNNSSDATAQVAEAAGALVRFESRPGKGNVVRRAFADIDADVYLMIDGDDTYDASAAGEMIATLQAGPLDQVVGVRRVSDQTAGAYRPGHETGNRLFNKLVEFLFGEPTTDMLSGYRVFSRRFVKSFPALSHAFEIETELTIHSMRLRVPQAEVSVAFQDRPDGSESKLRTYHDGFRILRLIAALFMHERPVFFFGMLAAFFGTLALATPALLFAGVHSWGVGAASIVLALLTVLSAIVGIVLGGTLRARQDSARLDYLRWLAPHWSGYDQMAEAAEGRQRAAVNVEVPIPDSAVT